MSISKSKVTPLAVANNMPQGVSDEVVDALNAVNDRLLSKLFPKDANVVLALVIGRVLNLGARFPQLLIADTTANNRLRANDVPNFISLTSANKMIRAYAGNVKVPDDTKAYVSFHIEALMDAIIAEAAIKASARGVSKISLKDVRDALNDPRSAINELKPLVTGSVRRRLSSPRKRLSKKKSASKKKKSASKKKKSKSKKSKSKSRPSTKKCPQGKKAVHSYKYKSSSGKKVKVKAYCRKKSQSK
jgi:Mg-chelatase subunit ChlI